MLSLRVVCSTRSPAALCDRTTVQHLLGFACSKGGRLTNSLRSVDSFAPSSVVLKAEIFINNRQLQLVVLTSGFLVLAAAAFDRVNDRRRFRFALSLKDQELRRPTLAFTIERIGNSSY